MRDLEKEPRLSQKQKRIVSIASCALFLAFFGLIAYYIGRPMIRFVKAPEQFRAWVDAHGIWGWAAFIGMQILQVVVAVIPGEPLEIGAGYAFGAVEGTLLCVIGNTIGGMLIFALVRTLGLKIVDLFFSREKILSLKFLQNQQRFRLLTWLIFLLPGTPKDLLSYFIGLTNIPWSTWLLITSIGRLPSIVTSTVCGGQLGRQNYLPALIVLLVTLALSGAGLLIYRGICRYHNKKQKE